MSTMRLPEGSPICECAACGECFATEESFDRHRVGRYRVPGDRRCLPAETLATLGSRVSKYDVWSIRRTA